MTGQPFTKTHTIVIMRNGASYASAQRIPVMRVDGALYTEIEWRTQTAADWEREPDGTITFQGQIPICDRYFLES